MIDDEDDARFVCSLTVSEKKARRSPRLVRQWMRKMLRRPVVGQNDACGFSAYLHQKNLTLILPVNCKVATTSEGRYIAYQTIARDMPDLMYDDFSFGTRYYASSVSYFGYTLQLRPEIRPIKYPWRALHIVRFPITIRILAANVLCNTGLLSCSNNRCSMYKVIILSSETNILRFRFARSIH